MDRVHPTAPSVSESVDLEQRQHVNIVYYENQNAMHQRLLVIDEDGKRNWNYDYYDLIHIAGTILHVAYEWVIHIFFICFMVIVGHMEYLPAPIIAILSIYLTYFGYWKDKPHLFKITIAVEVMISVFYFGFGIMLIMEYTTKYQRTSVFLYPAYSENSLALGIYLISCSPVQILFIYTIYRAIRYGHSMFYWALTISDEILLFRIVVFFSIIVLIVMTCVLIAVKSVAGSQY